MSIRKNRAARAHSLVARLEGRIRDAKKRGDWLAAGRYEKKQEQAFRKMKSALALEDVAEKQRNRRVIESDKGA